MTELFPSVLVWSRCNTLTVPMDQSSNMNAKNTAGEHKSSSEGKKNPNMTLWGLHIYEHLRL